MNYNNGQNPAGGHPNAPPMQMPPQQHPIPPGPPPQNIPPYQQPQNIPPAATVLPMPSVGINTKPNVYNTYKHWAFLGGIGAMAGLMFALALFLAILFPFVGFTGMVEGVFSIPNFDSVRRNTKIDPIDSFFHLFPKFGPRPFSIGTHGSFIYKLLGDCVVCNWCWCAVAIGLVLIAMSVFCGIGRIIGYFL